MTQEVLDRITAISFEEKLNHLSSNLSAALALDEIFGQKKADDIFILSCGNSGLALYAILEKYYGIDAVELLHKHGPYPKKDVDNHIVCSAYNTGAGLSIAIGHALANPNKTVYCLISDGECSKGTTWESLRFIHEHNVNNIRVYINLNGTTGYSNVDVSSLVSKICVFLPDINIKITNPLKWPFATGFEVHHCVLTPEQYKLFTEPQ